MTKKAKADVWMPLYVAEWDLSTGHLTNEQDGAYGRLVRWYWRNGAPLPDDDEALASIVRVDVKTWRKVLRPKLAPFFVVGNGVWRHTRVDATMTEWSDRKAKASEKAAKAAAGRWTGDAPKGSKGNASGISASDAPSIRQALHMQCPSSSSTEEEDPSGSSSLSGGAAVRSSVPADVRAAFGRHRDPDWVGSYIAPCGWNDAERLLIPATPFAGDKIRSEGRKALSELAHSGAPVRVLEARH